MELIFFIESDISIIRKGWKRKSACVKMSLHNKESTFNNICVTYISLPSNLTE